MLLCNLLDLRILFNCLLLRDITKQNPNSAPLLFSAVLIGAQETLLEYSVLHDLVDLFGKQQDLLEVGIAAYELDGGAQDLGYF